jgi:hypothetical protein
MYVDDSGSPNPKDNSDYYVILGIIAHELDIRKMEIDTRKFKTDYMKEYKHCEIHLHDMYKSQKGFSNLSLTRKYEILDDLYRFINDLPIEIIVVGIDKLEFTNRYGNKGIFPAAWTFLVERFESYIDDVGRNHNEGIIIVDTSAKMPQKEICTVVNRLRKKGSRYKEINHLIEEPIFIQSNIREGIQIADACAYCALKHLTGYDKFNPYWSIVETKLLRSPAGNPEGYGYKIFP